MNFASNLRHQLGHYSFRRLIEDDQLGPHHQASRNREHLLFAAREGVAGLLEPFFKARKARKDVILTLGIALALQSNIEVFQHCQVGKNSPALRDVADALARYFMRMAAREIDTVEFNHPATARRKSHDRAQGRRLAHPISAE